MIPFILQLCLVCNSCLVRLSGREYDRRGDRPVLKQTDNPDNVHLTRREQVNHYGKIGTHWELEARTS
ncbi:UNVERIFIED_CONTAM: hypothetical protein K2H54_018813 [Gekko kuhli]